MIEKQQDATVLPYQGDELGVFADALNWKRYIASALRAYVGNEVLEVGAGIGTTTRILCRGVEQWTCLEPDPVMVGQLTDAVKLGTLPPVCTVRSGTVGDMIRNDEKSRYDSILYIDVLEHVEDDRSELLNAIEFLRPGGFLVVLSPAIPWLYSPFDAAIGHFRRYDRSSISKISPPGISLVRIQYLDSVGLLASLVNRLFLRSGLPTRRQVLTWDRLMVPMSRLIDPLLGRAIGKSVLAVWQR